MQSDVSDGKGGFGIVEDWTCAWPCRRSSRWVRRALRLRKGVRQ